MKHVVARRVLTGLLSLLPLAGFAGNGAHRVSPPPPDSPLAMLPVDPRHKGISPDHDRNGDAHRDRGIPPEWIRQHGTSVYDQATGIASSKTHVFTTGHTGASIDGNTSAGSQDIFLMKHSLSGVHEWTRQLGSPANDYATGVAVFNPDNPSIYVTGYTFSRFPSVPGLNAGGADMFLTKYDDGGTDVWTRQLGSSGNDYGQAVATDAAGNVYVAGYTTGKLDTNTNAGLKDLFLAKYDANGNKLWTRQLGTPKNDEARAVTVDAKGFIYVAGLTYGSLPDNTGLGDADMFVAKYDDMGTRKWVKQFGTSDVDVAQGITTTLSNTNVVDVYVSGYTLGEFVAPRKGGYDAVVVKLNDQGAEGWRVQRGSAGNDLAYGITSDGSGKLFFTGTTNYDLDTNLSAGSNDVFLTELRASDGGHTLSRQLGSTHADNALDEGDITFGVTLDPERSIYVAGYTEGEFADTLLAGDKDVLIVKYGESCKFLPGNKCGGAYGWGDPHNVTFDYAAYNFQAVGEFILAESTSGSPLTIQVRQANWGGGVAVFSAVAARVGTARVAIYRENTANVYIDGTATPVTGFTPLPGGGSITRESDGAYLVAWPGAERMKVYNYGNYLNIYVLLPPYRQGTVRGLFGNYNGDPADDFALRDGTQLAAPLSFEQMYRDANSFAHSWRITQAESLFDYAAGQSTATFTDLNAPYTWASSQNLTPQERQDAEAICLNAGVSQPFALEACILDVGLTGDPSFATGAANVEAALLVQNPTTVPPPAPQPIYTQDFSGPVGPEWSSSQTSISPLGNRKFLGAFGNAPVTLAVQNLPDHSKVLVTFDLFIIGGWAGNAWDVNIDGVGLLRTTFSNTSSSQSFPTWNATVSNPARSGAAEVNSLGYAGGDSVYKVKLNLDHFDPALRLDFFGEGLGASQTWGVDNVQVQLQ